MKKGQRVKLKNTTGIIIKKYVNILLIKWDKTGKTEWVFSKQLEVI